MTPSPLRGESDGYELPVYAFVPPPELAQGKQGRYSVVIVGGGLSGLTLACDLAQRGIDCVVLDEDDTIGVRGASSRGICYAQKTLEIFARLGIYDRIRDKGVTWSVGKTLAGADVVYSFNLQLTNASEQPPFINLQQFYIEWFLVDRIRELGHCDLRWKNQVVSVTQTDDEVTVTVETPAGRYHLAADWLIDATGVNSRIRSGFGLDPHTSHIADRWCITDVRFKEKFPIERWTWIEAPFNEDRAVWQHPMADDVWRLDYQMPTRTT
jgi:3-(3-hydroxy-phenyl)propionate hydroxylase